MKLHSLQIRDHSEGLNTFLQYHHSVRFKIVHISKTQTTLKCSFFLLSLSASLENFIITNHGEGLPPGDGERAFSKCDNHEITLPLNLPNCQHPVWLFKCWLKATKSTLKCWTEKWKLRHIWKNTNKTDIAMQPQLKTITTEWHYEALFKCLMYH